MNKVENELVHYGVPNQEWGKRKYQYEDGSLTPAGYVHYGVGQARKAASAAVKTAKKVSKAAGTKVAETSKKVGQKTKEVASKAGKAASTAVKRSALKAAYKASDGIAALKKAREEAKKSNADLKAKRAAEKEAKTKEKIQNAEKNKQNNKQQNDGEKKLTKEEEIELAARDRSKMQDQIMKTFRGYYDPTFVAKRLERIKAETELKDAINKEDALDRSFLDRMVNAKADHDTRKMYRQRKKYSTKELQEAKKALDNRISLYGKDLNDLHDNDKLDKSKTVEMVKDVAKTAADPLKIKKGLTGLYNAYTTNTDKKSKKQAERAQKSAQKDYDAAKKNEATHEKFYKESRESMVNAYSEWQKNPTKENYDKYTHAFNNSRSALSSYNDTKAATSKALTTLDKYTTNNNNIKEAETKKQQVKADVNEAWAVAYGLYNLYKDNK